jgi:hypothetical protein
MKTKLLLALTLLVGANAQSKSSLRENVRLELNRPTQDGALVHWKITNNLDVAVYVYNFYLWGPAYRVETQQNRVIIETAPVAEQSSCPPNRFPPVLLLPVGPHRTVEGDFIDANVNAYGKAILMKAAVGSDPYSVVAEAKRFFNSKCQHSPYDAIVRWGAILESNEFQVEPKKK